MTRLGYWEWKHEVECLLGERIEWQMNEVIWALYDEKMHPSDAVVQILRRAYPGCRVIQTGYRGVVRGIIPKDEMASYR